MTPRQTSSFVAAAVLFAAVSAPALAQQLQKPCVAPLGWWESKGLQPYFTNPKGGAPQTDCNFQLWSWSAFVHWIQNDPKTGVPLLLELPIHDDLKSGLAARAMVGPRTPTLKPRTQKPKAMSSIEQAGSKGVLVDQSGRVVYYAAHMAPIYFGFTQKYFGPARYARRRRR